MAKLFIEDTSLTAIGDAIRSKSGSSELLSVPDGMVAAIEGITTGGGSAEVPEEVLTITGNCEDRFTNDGWNNYVNYFGNKIKTENITNAKNMFYGSEELEEIPFELNIKDRTNFEGTFENCKKLKTAPKINGRIGQANDMFMGCTELVSVPELTMLGSTETASNTKYAFSNCNNVKEITFKDWMPYQVQYMFQSAYRLEYIHLENYIPRKEQYGSCFDSVAYLFVRCYALREIPSEFLGNMITSRTSASYFTSVFEECTALDELVGLPIFSSENLTSNIFSSMFKNLNRVKELTFALNEDGTPKVVKWANQTIDLSSGIGYKLLSKGVATDSNGVQHNNPYFCYYGNIPLEKEVRDAAGHKALVKDADWWSDTYTWSRYNHDSAVNTINSLPDTSAFIATNGGTNTIKFNGKSAIGYNNAINKLTEEEIAVATAKGWTVSL